MSGYGTGYGDGGVTGYEDPNALSGYGSAVGQAGSVCTDVVHFACLSPMLLIL